jgi:zinc transport system substrate-binding protein
MKNYFRILLLAALVATVGCTEQKREASNTIFVSIAPLKPIVEGIVGDDFTVSVIVPQGAAPETFEPTPKQLSEIENAKFIFSVGLLDFEKSLVQRISKSGQIVELYKGVELMQGTCSHGHKHGVDPHIWCSPKSLGTMADNAYKAISADMPDSLHYAENYNKLCVKVLELEEEVAEIFHSGKQSAFIIYHPALTYLSRDYDLKQIAIEEHGKEPSVRRIGEIIEYARKEGIKRVLYQSELPASSVEAICKDSGAQAVEINPLAEDIFANIRTITTLIAE